MPLKKFEIVKNSVDGFWEIALIMVISVTCSMDIIGKRTGITAFLRKLMPITL